MTKDVDWNRLLTDAFMINPKYLGENKISEVIATTLGINKQMGHEISDLDIEKWKAGESSDLVTGLVACLTEYLLPTKNQSIADPCIGFDDLLVLLTHSIMKREIEYQELIAWVPQIPKIVSSRASSERAKARYKDGAALYPRAISIAEELWINGDERLHNEMRDYLLGEYKDENDENPFYLFICSQDEGFSKKGLLKKLKLFCREKLHKQELIYDKSK